jgi:hypothetical protein
MSRAQSFSLQTIVIAVLVIAVLVILLFVFRDKISDTGDNLSSCELTGGECKGVCADDEIELNADCDGGVCCGTFELEDT